MKRFLLSILSLTVLSVSAADFKVSNISIEKNSYYVVESDKLIVYFNRIGGRIDRIYHKPARQEFVNTDYRGVFTEFDWKKDISRDYLYKRPFSLYGEQRGENFVVECRGHHMGGGIDFLEVTKRYTLTRGSAAIKVDYDFFHQDAAMGKSIYAFRIHTGLLLFKEGSPKYFIPSDKGIRDSKGGDDWEHSPSRPWLAVNAPSGNGFAVTTSFPELQNYLLFEKKTMEISFRPMEIVNGKSWKTTFQIIPFTALPKVSGAGNGIAGAIIHEEKAAVKTDIPLEIRIFNSNKGKVSVELFKRDSNNAAWQKVKSAELIFNQRDTVKNFSASIRRQSNGCTELEAVIKSGNKELARLNSRVIIGNAGDSWKIDHLQKQLESVIKAYDYTGWTHHEPDPEAFPFAKPLAGGKIKLLALTPHIPQIGDLSDRLDITYGMSWVYQNNGKLMAGVYKFAEDYGNGSKEAVFNNMRKALAKDYDVILIGGILYSEFPADIRNTISKKVQAGTGLIYTAVHDRVDMTSLGAMSRGSKIKGVPVAVKDNFLTSGIPFELFPASDVFPFKENPNAVATVGKTPYITVNNWGKGKVVAYTFSPKMYFSVLIPHDPPEPYYVYDHPTPVDLYFSMLAKGIICASGRTMPLELGNFDAKINNDRAQITLNTTSAYSGKAKVEYRIYNRFNELRSSGSKDADLISGKNTLTLDLPVSKYAGDQYITMVIRNDKGEVLNWGSWSVKNEPASVIKSVVTDRKNYRDGETVNYEVTVSGGAPQLRIDLVDSYDRLLARKTGKASEIGKGSFVLKNELPSRYSRIRVYLFNADGKEVDMRGCYFITRPADKLLAWDEFKVNSIIYWHDADAYYRMKRNAQIYRKFGLDILMNCWGDPHPLLGNFEVRSMAPNGIGSQNFASNEYLKTGNKQLLARKKCISDPELQKKWREGWKKYGQHGFNVGASFYDCGDELALSRSGAPVDFCFSTYCLHNFREFLKKRYGTLENLNAQWESKFTSWEKVIPFTKEEVWSAKGKHVAGWSDHREFMDEVVANHLLEVKAGLRKYDPNARLSNSGTQNPNAYGGMDWWKQMQAFDVLQNYSGKHYDEIHRSFGKAGYRSIPWYIGYNHLGKEQIWKIWRSSLMGNHGMSLWCIQSTVLFPDLTFQKPLRDALPSLLTLRNGVGRLLMNVCKEPAPQVAVYYSQASLRAAFIERRMPDHQEMWTKYVLLCRNMGVPFRFVSYEEVAKGVLDNSSFKLLVMPDTTAMSDEEVAAVRRFFTNGGCVLAEGTPAKRYANCRKRETPALKDIFRRSKGRSKVSDEPDPSYVLLSAAPDSKLNRKQLVFEQNQFAAILKKAGITPRPVKLFNQDKSPLIEAEYFIRRFPDGSLLAGITSTVEVRKQAHLVLPESGHVYDLVSGRYLGKGKEFQIAFDQGLPQALAVLKAQPEFAPVKVSGNSIQIELKNISDTVVRCTVIAPDGREVGEYSANVTVKDGKAGFTVPFALSDAAGIWTVKIREVISGKVIEAKISRADALK
ncbi:MAG: hypothetical protein E7058_08090 [Lentisphaerae bacterium]|nr:hypothetical protein [Lentisphaerota bacterium]